MTTHTLLSPAWEVRALLRGATQFRRPVRRKDQPAEYVWIKGRAVNKYRTLWDMQFSAKGYPWDGSFCWVVNVREEPTA